MEKIRLSPDMGGQSVPAAYMPCMAKASASVAVDGLRKDRENPKSRSAHHFSPYVALTPHIWGIRLEIPPNDEKSKHKLLYEFSPV